MSKDVIKKAKILKGKDKNDNTSKSQKEIKTENIPDSKNKKDLSLSSYNNSKTKTNQNELNLRKYSDNNSRKDNNEFNKIKNGKVSRNYSNVNNLHQVDWDKKDNNPFISSNPLNNLTIKNSVNTINNTKYIIDLKDHNNINNNTIENSNNINKNHSTTNNAINEGDNNINSSIEKEKKFSIIDIPSPTFAQKHNENNIIININENPSKNINMDLSLKEKAYYILTKSPILSLRSQIIFSRSSNNIKKLISTKDILQNYELFINNKIKDYEKKINSYNEKITSIFTPSKIAEITLNFITKNNEIELCNIYKELLQDKNDYYFIYYNNYIKILFLIINENIEENISDDKLLSHLYSILRKKGYNNIKDYLYFLFISKNNTKKDNCFIKNIEKIEEIITNKVPRLLNFEESTKMCKFIGFSFYLIKETIDFGNYIKNTTKLKIDTNIFISNLKNNLDKFKKKFIK